jgi:hypothetical protein
MTSIAFPPSIRLGLRLRLRLGLGLRFGSCNYSLMYKWVRVRVRARVRVSIRVRFDSPCFPIKWDASVPAILVLLLTLFELPLLENRNL